MTSRLASLLSPLHRRAVSLCPLSLAPKWLRAFVFALPALCLQLCPDVSARPVHMHALHVVRLSTVVMPERPGRIVCSPRFRPASASAADGRQRKRLSTLRDMLSFTTTCRRIKNPNLVLIIPETVALTRPFLGIFPQANMRATFLSCSDLFYHQSVLACLPIVVLGGGNMISKDLTLWLRLRRR